MDCPWSHKESDMTERLSKKAKIMLGEISQRKTNIIYVESKIYNRLGNITTTKNRLRCREQTRG